MKKNLILKNFFIYFSAIIVFLIMFFPLYGLILTSIQPENIIRSIPKNLTANIDLSKIKVPKIFKWLKNKNISEIEMLKTFNCGVGFCLIAEKHNLNRIKKYFNKKFEPYEIGYISKTSKKLKLLNNILW